MNEIDSIYADWFVEGEIEGLRFHVTVESDEFNDPYKEEWATPEHIKRFEQDLWEYATVVVTPVYQGVEIETCSAAVSGVVHGFLNPDAERIGKESLAQYPVPELVEEAAGTLRGAGLGVEIGGHLQDASDARERADKLKALQKLLKEAK